MRNIYIIFSNFKVSVLSEMAHKIHFFVRFLSDALYFAVYFIFYTVIFSYVPNINGWGKYHVLLLMGTFHIVISLFLTFFFPNLVEIPNLVKSGGLDGILVKPIDSQFLLSTHIVDIGSFVNVLLGISIIIISVSKLGIKIGIEEIMLFVLYTLIGVFIMYNMLFIMLCSVFWIEDSSWGIGFFMSFNSFGDKPISMYKNIMYRFLIFIFPIGLVANIPANIILNEDNQSMEIWMVMIALVLYMISKYVWKAGIKLYEGASV